MINKRTRGERGASAGRELYSIELRCGVQRGSGNGGERYGSGILAVLDVLFFTTLNVFWLGFDMNSTEKLINLVQSYPCLYDKSNKDFKNSFKKEIIWDNIAKELNQSREYIFHLFN